MTLPSCGRAGRSMRRREFISFFGNLGRLDRSQHVRSRARGVSELGY